MFRFGSDGTGFVLPFPHSRNGPGDSRFNLGPPNFSAFCLLVAFLFKELTFCIPDCYYEPIYSFRKMSQSLLFRASVSAVAIGPFEKGDLSIFVRMISEAELCKMLGSKWRPLRH